MTEETYELSRRKILASAGVIGAAGATTGLGTSAFFSDQETFTNNQLVAGDLDLKVDWEEHYSDWLGSETDISGIQMSDPEDDDYTGFPSAAPDDEKSVWVPDEKVDAFMASTAIDAFPDVVNLDTPENIGASDYDGQQAALNDDDLICDLPADLDGVLSHPFRTGANVDGGVTIEGQTTEAGDPLVDIEDVKPGDFGEVTLSFHICGNPGYVWLTGDLRANDENTVTEPEAEDPDENNEQTNQEISGDGELLNAIRTRLWYDNGDNVYEDETAITPPLSLGELLLFLEGGTGIQLCAAEGTGTVVEPPAGSGDCPENDDYDSVHATGETITRNKPFGEGTEQFTIPQNPKCTDFGLIQGVKTDEDEDGPLEYPGSVGGMKDNEFDTPYGTITVTTTLLSANGGDPIQAIDSWAINSDDDFCVAKVIVKGGREGANVYSYDNDDGDTDFTNDPDDIGAESSDSGENLQTPTGQDISHVSFCLAVGTSDPEDPGDTGMSDNCCFDPSTTQYVGFEWWLPVDHANEIQTDSVSFDLGFYTEQCRHNDGSGMANTSEPEPQ